MCGTASGRRRGRGRATVGGWCGATAGVGGRAGHWPVGLPCRILARSELAYREERCARRRRGVRRALRVWGRAKAVVWRLFGCAGGSERVCAVRATVGIGGGGIGLWRVKG